MKTIHILTGAVQTGKTTRLAGWVRQQSDCAGILAPVQDERRRLVSIRGGASRRLELGPGEAADKEVIAVGCHRFLAATFAWAQKELRKAALAEPAWLVVDEIGPLELAGQGLGPAVGEILARYRPGGGRRLVLVVRDRLLDRVVRHYRLDGRFDTDPGFLTAARE